MANVFDYVDWRGDISYDISPFNEVDNLLFSYLSYINFDGIVPQGDRHETVTLREVTDSFFNRHTKEEIMARPEATKVACFLLQKMVGTKRFGSTKLAAYRQLNDHDSSTQFSAVTFILPDHSCYAAFRGTDDTLVGWKEDLKFSLKRNTQGQEYAAGYLSSIFHRSRCNIRVGGHSKGGNFAIYAASFCSPAVQDRIVHVYSNDGPGFRENVLQSEGYKKILPRVSGYLPEDSLVGVCLDNHIRHKLIKTSVAGEMAHDPQNWLVVRDHFVPGDAQSEQSAIFDKTIRNWIAGLDDKTREAFIDMVFELMEKTGAEKMSQITDNIYLSEFKMLRELNKYPKEDQDMFKKIMIRYFSSNIYARITSAVNRFLDKKESSDNK